MEVAAQTARPIRVPATRAPSFAALTSAARLFQVVDHCRVLVVSALRREQPPSRPASSRDVSDVPDRNSRTGAGARPDSPWESHSSRAFPVDNPGSGSGRSRPARSPRVVRPVSSRASRRAPAR